MLLAILIALIVILAIITAVNSMKLQELEENYNVERRALNKIKEVITTANVK